MAFDLSDLVIPFALSLLAGLSTGIGGLIVLLVRKPSYTFMGFTLGAAAGVMLFVSFVELLAKAIEDVGFVPANLAFFIGMAAIFAIDLLVPHRFMDDRHENATADSRLLKTGVLVALGMAIHNFPEGMIVFVSALESPGLGLVLAFAISIHNIPEGIAVAVPIYRATGSRLRALGLATLSGLAEPAGALVGALILLPFLTSDLMPLVLALVAGIMVFISLDELLPSAHRYGQEHWVILGMVAGMLVMAASLALL